VGKRWFLTVLKQPVNAAVGVWRVSVQPPSSALPSDQILISGEVFRRVPRLQEAEHPSFRKSSQLVNSIPINVRVLSWSSRLGHKSEMTPAAARWVTGWIILRSGASCIAGSARLIRKGGVIMRH